MEAQTIKRLDVEQAPVGKISYYWLHIINNKFGEPIRIPIMVARGKKPGPVLGVTAAMHGNELNGIPVIQQLFKGLNINELSGTVVGVLIMNVPALLLEQRVFNEGTDLNRITPGKTDGNCPQVYAYRLVDRILSQFNYHIDLHTASFGRINSFYIRADMQNPNTAEMAKLQNADIILHNLGNDGTLRGTAEDLGIHSITVELKDPHVFQWDVIEDGLVGIRNVMYYLNMLEGMVIPAINATVVCESSKWIYTDEGGVLQVFPDVCEHLKAGDKIAEVRNIFGTMTKEYFAPHDGVVIGRSINPLNQTGSRIIHFGKDISYVNGH
jgi:predicted deacylase